MRTVYIVEHVLVDLKKDGMLIDQFESTTFTDLNEAEVEFKRVNYMDNGFTYILSKVTLEYNINTGDYEATDIECLKDGYSIWRAEQDNA